MKKILIILVFLVLSVAVFFFLDRKQEETGEEITSDTVVKWENPIFEKNVREMLEMPSGDIRVSDLEDITCLHIFGADLVSTSMPSDEEAKEEYNFAEKQTFRELKYFTNLEIFNCRRTEIVDYDFLKQVPSLYSLSFTDCRLPEEALPNLRLRSLLFSSCGEVDLETLPHPESCVYLVLDNVEIRNEEALGQFVNLQQLFICKTAIEDISAISSCKNITHLELSDNHIASLKGVEELGKLELLDASGNMVQDIQPVLQCVNLVYLDLSYNQITSLEGLEQLQKLQSSFFEGNPIEE